MGTTVSALRAETTVSSDNPQKQETAHVGVKVSNRSKPALCAEKDNVTLSFAHPKVMSFRIEVAHPSYINTLQKDSYNPDWTDCDFGPSGTAKPPPEKITLYEDVNLWVVGFRFANFWRNRDVPFRVGEETYNGLHLIQIWIRHDERAEEVLVVYPADGYWRARPLPPKHLGWSTYGSSFMVGPIEDAGRPVVNLASIGFDPVERVFALKFAGGGLATVAMTKLDRHRQIIDVEFEEPIQGPPFAALRSMYITRFNNDVAEIAILEDGTAGWREQSIMTFETSNSARKIWTGRHFPSRHNTSAPDIMFGSFAGRQASRPTKQDGANTHSKAK